MALIWADRVVETTTTTGTGALALAGAVAGYQDFDAVCANNDTIYYCIEAINANGYPTGEWEVGLGTFTDTDTLTRTTVLASSNAGSVVTLSAGTKRVFASNPAHYIQKKPESLVIAVSDETTDLTTGTAKTTFRMPYAFTLTAVRASVTTAPTGSVLTVDINESGTTILSTKLTIDATEKTSTTAATAAVISDASLADDAEITIDIDGIGSTIAGAGLKVALIGYQA
jgi:hypothetical protein